MADDVNSNEIPQFHLRRIGRKSSVPGVVDFIHFDRATTLIGRKQDVVDYFISCPSANSKDYISRTHARVIRIPPLNTYKIVDSSLTGIYINDIRIGDEVNLQEGDTVTFGHPQSVNIPPGTRVRQPSSESYFLFERCLCHTDQALSLSVEHSSMRSDGIPKIQLPFLASMQVPDLCSPNIAFMKNIGFSVLSHPLWTSRTPDLSNLAVTVSSSGETQRSGTSVSMPSTSTLSALCSINVCTNSNQGVANISAAPENSTSQLSQDPQLERSSRSEFQVVRSTSPEYNCVGSFQARSHGKDSAVKIHQTPLCIETVESRNGSPNFDSPYEKVSRVQKCKDEDYKDLECKRMEDPEYCMETSGQSPYVNVNDKKVKSVHPNSDCDKGDQCSDRSLHVPLSEAVLFKHERSHTLELSFPRTNTSAVHGCGNLSEVEQDVELDVSQLEMQEVFHKASSTPVLSVDCFKQKGTEKESKDILAKAVHGDVQGIPCTSTSSASIDHPEALLAEEEGASARSSQFMPVKVENLSSSIERYTSNNTSNVYILSREPGVQCPNSKEAPNGNVVDKGFFEEDMDLNSSSLTEEASSELSDSGVLDVNVPSVCVPHSGIKGQVCNNLILDLTEQNQTSEQHPKHSTSLEQENNTSTGDQLCLEMSRMENEAGAATRQIEHKGADVLLQEDKMTTGEKLPNKQLGTSDFSKTPVYVAETNSRSVSSCSKDAAVDQDREESIPATPSIGDNCSCSEEVLGISMHKSMTVCFRTNEMDVSENYVGCTEIQHDANEEVSMFQNCPSVDETDVGHTAKTEHFVSEKSIDHIQMDSFPEQDCTANRVGFCPEESLVSEGVYSGSLLNDSHCENVTSGSDTQPPVDDMDIEKSCHSGLIFEPSSITFRKRKETMVQESLLTDGHSEKTFTPETRELKMCLHRLPQNERFENDLEFKLCADQNISGSTSASDCLCMQLHSEPLSAEHRFGDTRDCGMKQMNVLKENSAFNEHVGSDKGMANMQTEEISLNIDMKCVSSLTESDAVLHKDPGEEAGERTQIKIVPIERKSETVVDDKACAAELLEITSGIGISLEKIIQIGVDTHTTDTINEKDTDIHAVNSENLNTNVFWGLNSIDPTIDGHKADDAEDPFMDLMQTSSHKHCLEDIDKHAKVTNTVTVSSTDNEHIYLPLISITESIEESQLTETSTSAVLKEIVSTDAQSLKVLQENIVSLSVTETAHPLLSSASDACPPQENCLKSSEERFEKHDSFGDLSVDASTADEELKENPILGSFKVPNSQASQLMRLACDGNKTQIEIGCHELQLGEDAPVNNCETTEVQRVYHCSKGNILKASHEGLEIPEIYLAEKMEEIAYGDMSLQTEVKFKCMDANAQNMDSTSATAPTACSSGNNIEKSTEMLGSTGEDSSSSLASNLETVSFPHPATGGKRSSSLIDTILIPVSSENGLKQKGDNDMEMKRNAMATDESFKKYNLVVKGDENIIEYSCRGKIETPNSDTNILTTSVVDSNTHSELLLQYSVDNQQEMDFTPIELPNVVSKEIAETDVKLFNGHVNNDESDTKNKMVTEDYEQVNLSCNSLTLFVPEKDAGDLLQKGDIERKSECKIITKPELKASVSNTDVHSSAGNGAMLDVDSENLNETPSGELRESFGQGEVRLHISDSECVLDDDNEGYHGKKQLLNEEKSDTTQLLASNTDRVTSSSAKGLELHSKPTENPKTELGVSVLKNEERFVTRDHVEKCTEIQGVKLVGSLPKLSTMLHRGFENEIHVASTIKSKDPSEQLCELQQVNKVVHQNDQSDFTRICDDVLNQDNVHCINLQSRPERIEKVETEKDTTRELDLIPACSILENMAVEPVLHVKKWMLKCPAEINEEPNKMFCSGGESRPAHDHNMSEASTSREDAQDTLIGLVDGGMSKQDVFSSASLESSDTANHSALNEQDRNLHSKPNESRRDIAHGRLRCELQESGEDERIELHSKECFLKEPPDSADHNCKMEDMESSSANRMLEMEYQKSISCQKTNAKENRSPDRNLKRTFNEDSHSEDEVVPPKKRCLVKCTSKPISKVPFKKNTFLTLQSDLSEYRDQLVGNLVRQFFEQRHRAYMKTLSGKVKLSVKRSNIQQSSLVALLVRSFFQSLSSDGSVENNLEKVECVVSHSENELPKNAESQHSEIANWENLPFGKSNVNSSPCVFINEQVYDDIFLKRNQALALDCDGLRPSVDGPCSDADVTKDLNVVSLEPENEITDDEKTDHSDAETISEAEQHQIHVKLAEVVHCSEKTVKADSNAASSTDVDCDLKGEVCGENNLNGDQAIAFECNESLRCSAINQCKLLGDVEETDVSSLVPEIEIIDNQKMGSTDVYAVSQGTQSQRNISLAEWGHSSENHIEELVLNAASSIHAASDTKEEGCEENTFNVIQTVPLSGYTSVYSTVDTPCGIQIVEELGESLLLPKGEIPGNAQRADDNEDTICKDELDEVNVGLSEEVHYSEARIGAVGLEASSPTHATTDRPKKCEERVNGTQAIGFDCAKSLGFSVDEQCSVQGVIEKLDDAFLVCREDMSDSQKEGGSDEERISDKDIDQISLTNAKSVQCLETQMEHVDSNTTAAFPIAPAGKLKYFKENTLNTNQAFALDSEEFLSDVAISSVPEVTYAQKADVKGESFSKDELGYVSITLTETAHSPGNEIEADRSVVGSSVCVNGDGKDHDGENNKLNGNQSVDVGSDPSSSSPIDRQQVIQIATGDIAESSVSSEEENTDVQNTDHSNADAPKAKPAESSFDLSDRFHHIQLLQGECSSAALSTHVAGGGKDPDRKENYSNNNQADSPEYDLSTSSSCSQCDVLDFEDSIVSSLLEDEEMPDSQKTDNEKAQTLSNVGMGQIHVSSADGNSFSEITCEAENSNAASPTSADEDIIEGDCDENNCNASQEVALDDDSCSSSFGSQLVIAEVSNDSSFVCEAAMDSQKTDGENKETVCNEGMGHLRIEFTDGVSFSESSLEYEGSSDALSTHVDGVRSEGCCGENRSVSQAVALEYGESSYSSFDSQCSISDASEDADVSSLVLEEENASQPTDCQELDYEEMGPTRIDVIEKSNPSKNLSVSEHLNSAALAQVDDSSEERDCDESSLNGNEASGLDVDTSLSSSLDGQSRIQVVTEDLDVKSADSSGASNVSEELDRISVGLADRIICSENQLKAEYSNAASNDDVGRKRDSDNTNGKQSIDLGYDESSSSSCVSQCRVSEVNVGFVSSLSPKGDLDTSQKTETMSEAIGQIRIGVVYSLANQMQTVALNAASSDQLHIRRNECVCKENNLNGNQAVELDHVKSLSSAACSQCRNREVIEDVDASPLVFEEKITDDQNAHNQDAEAVSKNEFGHIGGDCYSEHEKDTEVSTSAALSAHVDHKRARDCKKSTLNGNQDVAFDKCPGSSLYGKCRIQDVAENLKASSLVSEELTRNAENTNSRDEENMSNKELAHIMISLADGFNNSKMASNASTVPTLGDCDGKERVYDLNPIVVLHCTNSVGAQCMIQEFSEDLGVTALVPEEQNKCVKKSDDKDMNTSTEELGQIKGNSVDGVGKSTHRKEGDASDTAPSLCADSDKKDIMTPILPKDFSNDQQCPKSCAGLEPANVSHRSETGFPSADRDIMSSSSDIYDHTSDSDCDYIYYAELKDGSYKSIAQHEKPLNLHSTYIEELHLHRSEDTTTSSQTEAHTHTVHVFSGNINQPKQEANADCSEESEKASTESSANENEYTSVLHVKKSLNENTCIKREAVNDGFYPSQKTSKTVTAFSVQHEVYKVESNTDPKKDVAPIHCQGDDLNRSSRFMPASNISRIEDQQLPPGEFSTSEINPVNSLSQDAFCDAEQWSRNSTTQGKTTLSEWRIDSPQAHMKRKAPEDFHDHVSSSLRSEPSAIIVISSDSEDEKPVVSSQGVVIQTHESHRSSQADWATSIQNTRTPKGKLSLSIKRLKSSQQHSDVTLRPCSSSPVQYQANELNCNSSFGRSIASSVSKPNDSAILIDSSEEDQPVKEEAVDEDNQYGGVLGGKAIWQGNNNLQNYKGDGSLSLRSGNIQTEHSKTRHLEQQCFINQKSMNSVSEEHVTPLTIPTRFSIASGYSADHIKEKMYSNKGTCSFPTARSPVIPALQKSSSIKTSTCSRNSYVQPQRIEELMNVKLQEQILLPCTFDDDLDFSQPELDLERIYSSDEEKPGCSGDHVQRGPNFVLHSDKDVSIQSPLGVHVEDSRTNDSATMGDTHHIGSVHNSHFGELAMQNDWAFSEKDVKFELNQCKVVLSEMVRALSDVQGVDDGQMKQWRDIILKLQEQTKTFPKTYIAVVGDTGAGKSSLLNALLDEEAVLPTSGMRACTAVVVEVSHSTRKSKYEAEVEFLSEEEWDKELIALIRDMKNKSGHLKKRCPDPKTTSGVAYSRVKAVYGRIAELPELKQIQDVTQHLGTVKHISEDTAERFRAEIEKYIDSRTDELRNKKGGEYWPIVKCVKMYVPSAEVLKTGAVLVDLPGTRDSNAARDSAARKYLKNCHAVWVVAHITRAVDDKTAKELLNENLRRQLYMDGQYERLAFVCTKTDTYNKGEIKRALGLTRKLEPLESKLEELESRLKKMKMEKDHLYEQLLLQMKSQSFEKTPVHCQDGDSRSPRDLMEMDRDIYDLVGEKERTRREIDLICVKSRNEFSKERIQRDFNSGIQEIKKKFTELEEEDEENSEDDEEWDSSISDTVINRPIPHRKLHVYTVSSTEYLKLRGKLWQDGPSQVFMRVEDTEIPALKEFTIQTALRCGMVAAEKVIRSVASIISNVISYLSNQKAQDETQHAQIKEVVQSGLSELRQQLQVVMNKSLGDVSECFDVLIKNDLYRGVQKAEETCEEKVQRWGSHEAGGYSYATYKAVCSRQGIYTSPSCGHIDFNEHLAEPMTSSIAMIWNEVFSYKLVDCFKLFSIDVLAKLDLFFGTLKAELQPTKMDMERFDFIHKQQMEVCRVKLLNFILDQKRYIGMRQRKISRILTPEIESLMIPAYKGCDAVKGTGSFHRMKALMQDYVHKNKPTMFNCSAEKLMEQLSFLQVYIQAGFENVINKVCDSLTMQLNAMLTPVKKNKEIIPDLRRIWAQVRKICERSCVNFSLPDLESHYKLDASEEITTTDTEWLGDQELAGFSGRCKIVRIGEVDVPYINPIEISVKQITIPLRDRVPMVLPFSKVLHLEFCHTLYYLILHVPAEVSRSFIRLWLHDYSTDVGSKQVIIVLDRPQDSSPFHKLIKFISAKQQDTAWFQDVDLEQGRQTLDKLGVYFMDKKDSTEEGESMKESPSSSSWPSIAIQQETSISSLILHQYGRKRGGEHISNVLGKKLKFEGQTRHELSLSPFPSMEGSSQHICHPLSMPPTQSGSSRWNTTNQCHTLGRMSPPETIVRESNYKCNTPPFLQSFSNETPHSTDVKEEPQSGSFTVPSASGHLHIRSTDGILGQQQLPNIQGENGPAVEKSEFWDFSLHSQTSRTFRAHDQ